MSDWGLVSFYYDYEHENRRKEKKNVRGLISKAYKYPDVEGMILHAYNGIRYFWERRDDEYVDFGFDPFGLDQFSGRLELSDWAELNTAFDVFFEYGHISHGFDGVKYVIDNFDNLTDPDEDNEYLSGGKLGNDLFNCEGTYGWLFISYTGNSRDGYKLKYSYNYDEQPGDFRSAIKKRAEYVTKYGSDKDWEEKVLKEFEEVFEFFDENATVVKSKKAFWGFEKKGVEFIREMMTEAIRKQKKEKEELEERKNRLVDGKLVFSDEDPIDELELSVRSYNCLKRSGIDTVGQLRSMTADELLSVRNLGRKGVDEIMKKLEFSLSDGIDDE